MDVVTRLDALAADRDRWRRRSKYYHRAIGDIHRFFVPDGQSVLEAGCSTGDLLAYLRPARGVGIDVSGVAIELAKEKHGDNDDLTFAREDAETFATDEKFDYVVISDTIGYLRDVQKTLENLRRVMTARARLVVSFYNFVWEPIFLLAQRLGLKQKQPRQNWLSNADMVNLLELAGFEVVHREGFILLPIYIPLLSSLLNGFFAKLPLLRHLTVAQFIIARPAYRPTVEEADGYSVSVIIPARNEAGNIEAALTRTPAMGKWVEFVFVEGGSSDNTWREIQRVKEEHPDKRIKIMQQDGKGKGDAVRKGFANANGDILMILDADLTMPPEELPKYYRAIA